MKIEQIKTADLIPYARNSRSHSDAQVAQIAGSIREFGFTNPVLIDADNGIIAGHGRVMAASNLGMAEVPCIRLAHLTETQKRAYIVQGDGSP
jgi:ParB-like chromosome segregation protein Spo0J